MTTHKPKLTARQVETAPAGTYDDGRRLRLVVRPSGARSWILRYQLNGKRRNMGLGRWPETTLGMARDKALEVRRGIEPPGGTLSPSGGRPRGCCSGPLPRH